MVTLRRLAVAVGLVVAVVAAGAASDAHAAETDPYWAWLTPPEDGTAALNTAINERLEVGLAAVNALPASASLSCTQAARGLVAPLAPTALWYFVSDMQTWDVDHVPRDDAGYAVLKEQGTYRYAPLSPLGKLVRVDPTVRVGDVLFGTDKLGHFFTNGLRYLDRFDNAVAAGQTIGEAELAAVRLGIAQEKGWLGMGVCGVFSYADLEANWRGLLFFRELCAPERAMTTTTSQVQLVLRDGRWTLTRSFDIATFVDPCWDEAFATSAFAPAEQVPVRRAITELCPRWQRPDILERRRAYRERGCPARHQQLLTPLIVAGEAPDATPWSIDVLCRAAAPG